MSSVRLLDQLPVGVVVTDSDGYVVESNATARRFFGADGEPGGRFPQQFGPGSHRLPSPEAGVSGWSLEVVADPERAGHRILVVREDAQVSWTSEDTERLAFEDPLTGLPNWNILHQFVEHSCSQSQRYGRSSALLRVDLDHLRQINQELGRTTGDEILVEAAQRLQNNVRSSDIVGRLEGDQFLILLTELSSERSGARPETGDMSVQARAAVVAERLCRAFVQPMGDSDEKVQCTVSVGVSVCPDDARQSHDWMATAELALSHCKEKGGNGYELFAEALRQEHESRQDRTRQLDAALKIAGACDDPAALGFNWLAVQPSSDATDPLQAVSYYAWRWPAGHLAGPEVQDALTVGNLLPAWGRWQKSYLESLPEESGVRVAPLPPAWLHPSFDAGLLLRSGWWWEVQEEMLQHRSRLLALLALQDRGLQTVLACSSRGLQNLGLLGRLQPRLLRLPVPLRPTPEVQRLQKATAQVARSFAIDLLACVSPEGAAPDHLKSLAPDFTVQLPS